MSEINRDFDFILPFFELPDDQEEFDEFIRENPHKKILEKNIFNRGVKIIDVKNLEPKDEHFYQEFMDDPFLIDGHAFDFGVYVLITSFDPIRAYRFNEDVLLRFCSEKYHPFDPENRNKYVVKDGSIPAFEMPSFAEPSKKFSFSSKVMFENEIKKLKFDVKKFWTRIDRAIAQVVANAESRVVNGLLEKNLSSHNLFELVRFDIILDAELNPFVVEVNMSPNLTPAAEKYERNALIYEQLIYNVVKMIGGGSHHEFFSR
jgi:tubulin monoglycylase TTLL15